MLEAIQIWKLYPKQIESGIQAEYPGRHIREWHQGSMSSREFLVLIEGLSADSWFKASTLQDLRRMQAQSERSKMQAAHQLVEDHLEGRAHIPGAMPIGVVDKRTQTSESEVI